MADEPKTTAQAAKAAGEASDASSVQREHRRGRTGTVVSDRCDKTIGVRVDYLTKHRKYGKYIRRRTKVQVHDERNEAKVGDIVEIAECRPVSKSKSWRLVRVSTSA